MTEHPITPPPELVQQWMTEAHDQPPGPDARVIATQAARWGADIELEACCEWVSQWRCMVGGNRPEVGLRAARRPKPPSLKEQALLAIDTAVADGRLSPDVSNVIRRALEALSE